MIDLIMSFEIPEFEVTIKKEDYAPGIFAGSEGAKLIIESVDLETGKLKLKFENLMTIEDGR